MWALTISATCVVAAETTAAAPKFYEIDGALRNNRGEAIEQCLVRKYVPKDATGVLEMGVRTGMTTCVLSHWLRTPRVLVSVEPDARAWSNIERNLERNGCSTHLVRGVVGTQSFVRSAVNNAKGALSTQTYMPVTAATSVPAGAGHARGHAGGTRAGASSDTDAPAIVEAFRPDELAERFNVTFDTLVADCEGCVAKIVRDFPAFVASLHTIILEADYGVGLQPQGFADYNAMLGALLGMGFVVVEAFYHPCCHAASHRTGAILMYVLQHRLQLKRLFPSSRRGQLDGPCYGTPELNG